MSVGYFSVRKCRRLNGRTVYGMKKIVREKSECSYQSAMQTRGFASVMPSSANEKGRGAGEGNANGETRMCGTPVLAKG